MACRIFKIVKTLLLFIVAGNGWADVSSNENSDCLIMNACILLNATGLAIQNNPVSGDLTAHHGFSLILNFSKQVLL